MSTGPLRAALRTALSDEHAAVYLFAVLCSRTSPGALADQLRAAYDFHRAARDLLTDRLAALGEATAPGAEPAYALPHGLDAQAGVRAAALAAEQTASAQYADLVAATTGADRAQAIGWLSATAVRALGFGAAPQVLPGID